MLDITISLVSCFIAAAAFVYGAVKVLFKDKKPLYFKLIVAAVGCYLVEELNTLACYICSTVDASVSVGDFGILGAVLFLFTAEFGHLDGFVDDGCVSKRVKLTACIVPLLLVLSTVALDILLFSRYDLFSFICATLMLLAMVPTSYLAAKHLLMPQDAVGFLASTRRCNICTLLYFVLTHLYLYSALWQSVVLLNALGILVTILILALSISAERGSTKWTTSISSYLSV